MKSKTESISFTKWQLREQKWIGLAMILAYFVMFPITFLLNVDGMNVELILNDAMLPMELSYINSDYQLTSGGLTIVASALVFGVFAGITAYAYLHNRSHVGMIHSLPIRREGIMVSKFKAITASFLFAYGLPCMLYIVIVWMYGYLSPNIFLHIVIVSIYSVLMYWVGYLISSCAMLLTGRVFVGVFGTIVLMWYVPFVALIVSVMAEKFFYTYDGTYAFTQIVLRIFEKMSPFGMMIEFKCNTILSWFIISFVVVVLVITMWVLMKARSSEAAGKSMAYVTGGNIIKCALVVPAALSIGILFESIAKSYETNWLYFGIFFGVVVSYITMQLIYGVEFKNLFGQKIQVTGLLFMTICITSIFAFDVFNYDGYLPNANKVADINIAISNFSTGYGTTDMVDGTYEMGNSDELYQLASYIVSSSNDAHENENQDENQEERISLTVQYCLNNGQEVVRTYTPYASTVREDLKFLWSNEAFLNIMYPLRTQNVSAAFNVQLFGDSSYEAYYNYDEFLSGNQVKQQEFLSILQADLLAADGAEIVDEIPVGKVYYSMNGVGHDSYGCYIYPSFYDTLAYLEEAGEELTGTLDIEDIAEISIYNEETGVEKDYILESELEVILPYLVATELATPMQAFKDDKIVVVKFKEGEDASTRGEAGEMFRGNVEYRLLK